MLSLCDASARVEGWRTPRELHGRLTLELVQITYWYWGTPHARASNVHHFSGMRWAGGVQSWHDGLERGKQTARRLWTPHAGVVTGMLQRMSSILITTVSTWLVVRCTDLPRVRGAWQTENVHFKRAQKKSTGMTDEAFISLKARSKVDCSLERKVKWFTD